MKGLKQNNSVWLTLGILTGVFLFSPFFHVFAEDIDVTATVPAICGNGVQEGAEECDDGNAVDDDACSNACIEEDEQGGGVVVIVPPPVLPPPAICGNGIQEGNEQCDDGNGVNGDGCAAGCLNEGPAICGNGEKEGLEGCDDGNVQNGDFCSDQCQPTAVECGNGVREINEVCDDGNLVNGDGCSAVCQEEVPGAICGNRRVEQGETCDDGDQVSGDGCSNVCQVEPDPICGNGVRERIEVCDDGNRVDDDGCNNRCQFVPLPGSVCGNAVREPGEQCDDGNLRAGDGCTGACQLEEAGGVVIVDNGEQPERENPPEEVATSTPEASATSTPPSFPTTTPILEGVDTTKPITQNIAKVAQNIGKNISNGAKFLAEEAKFLGKKVEEVADNPQVEEVTKTVVAPATAAVAVATVTPSLASILFPLLRFVFLQPFLLFGRKRRQAWGQVYNSLTKLPVDLAMVRLLDAKTKKILQSRVTDTQGRYFFIAEPGDYIIEVTKPGFTFPSGILQGIKTDGKLVDIYHGEQINVTASGIGITPNIPLDPVGAVNQTPKRIIWDKRWKVIQHAVSVLGVILTGISLYIAPVWYMWILLGVHIVLYMAFMHFVKPKKPNGWGLVYEKDSTSPVGNTVVRLFTKQYNKLVSTQVTDKKGRYAFLVGPSDYYVTYEKKGYKPETSGDVHIDENEKNSVIKEKIELEKDQNK